MELKPRTEVPRSAVPLHRAFALRSSRVQAGPLGRLLPEFEAACAIAARCGLSGNQLLLSAARAVARTHGLDPLQLLGLHGLEGDAPHFAAGQLGRHLGKTAREVNADLERLGLQVRIDGVWTPTAEGRAHAVLVDVGKQHSDGAPVTQVRWRLSVLPLLDPADLLAAACA
jgi:hypothetical protein